MALAPADDLKNIKEQAYELCQTFLGDIWSELSIFEFEISKISRGLSNTLYLCSLPENVIVKNQKTPRQVLLRMYGPFQENLTIVLKEVVTFIFVAERKLGPKLYGVFPCGRLEEFIPSRSLSNKDYKGYRMMHRAIATELAKIHALDVPVSKIPDFWLVHTKRWLNDVEIHTKEKKNSTFEYSDLYTESIEWLLEEIKKSNSPVIFCHNDLVQGNILILDDSPSEEDPKLMLIDIEFGAYNYRGFDMANHFIEWCYDYENDQYPYFKYSFEKFPSEEEQISFIRAYLEQLVKEKVISPSRVEDEIKVILQEIDLFRMASDLMWSLWAFKMPFISRREFGFEEFGMIRLDAFRAVKKKYLNSMVNNGSSPSD